MRSIPRESQGAQDDMLGMQEYKGEDEVHADFSLGKLDGFIS